MKPGDKVVCVNDSPSKLGHKCPCKKGAVYVITEVLTVNNKLGLNLIGVRFRKNKFTNYTGIVASRFRLLDEIKAANAAAKRAAKSREYKPTEPIAA